MARQQSAANDASEANNPLYAFNRGIISALGLARTDFKRTALSATIMSNWMPRLLGSMMLRPGTFCIDATNSNETAIHIPFIFASNDTAIIEMTPDTMRVRVNEQVISRVAVATQTTNGTFVSNINGWTDADIGGAVSQWAAGNLMQLTGDGTNYAIRKQTVAVADGDLGKLHALRVVVEYADTVTGGDVRIQIGSTAGATDLIPVTSMRTGTYSLAFTPTTSNIFIQVQANAIYSCYVSQITIEPTGVLTLPTPYAAGDLYNIRSDQSADVIWLACKGYQMLRIERHSTYGWGISNYMPPDGPMLLPNITQTSITPSAITGGITLTASTPFFQAGHVGTVFSMASVGQQVTAALTAQNTFTNAVEVTGIGTSRNLIITTTGVWVGTLTLQYSVGAPGAWVTAATYTTNQTAVVYNDGFANDIIYYRIGFQAGQYTSGTATCTLSFAAGSITGIVRITAYTSPTSVSANVLTELGGTAATIIWSEGQWSAYRGFPTCVCLYGGRLWWAGGDNVDGSISNAYESFNIAQVGDSGPVIEGIGSGPIDTINWMLPMTWLVMGGQSAEHTIKTSVIDTPITPTNFIIRPPSNVGSTNVPAIKKDLEGFFISHNGTRLYKLSLQNVYYSFDYDAMDMTVFCPEITQVGIKRMAMQRFPDVRFHCVLNDGTVAVLIYDRTEDVQAWVPLQMNTALGAFDQVQDVFVIPNPAGTEDLVYYEVARTNGTFLERWALESECVGGAQNKNLDCHILYNGISTVNIPISVVTPTGTFYPFANKTVGVWANGVYLGTFPVTGNAATLNIGVASTSAVVGFVYPAAFQSTKLAYSLDGGTALTQRKKVDHLGIIAQNLHNQALYYGNAHDLKTAINSGVAASHMQPMPQMEYDQPVAPGTIYGTYDADPFEFPGEWSTDSRLGLYTPGGMPATLLAAVISMETTATL